MSEGIQTDPDELDSARLAVIDTVREMARRGLVEGTAGNVSLRTRASEVVLTPTATSYEDMTVDDLVLCDLQGSILSGERAPTTEIGLHLACLREHSEIAAVVHTHPVHACSFAVNRQTIPCFIEELEFEIGGDVPVAAYFPTGSAELGEAVAALLGNRAAVLMANHGLVVVGSTPAEALHLTKIVERAAQIALGALQLGNPHSLPEEIREQFRRQYLAARRRN